MVLASGLRQISDDLRFMTAVRQAVLIQPDLTIIEGERFGPRSNLSPHPVHGLDVLPPFCPAHLPNIEIPDPLSHVPQVGLRMDDRNPDQGSLDVLWHRCADPPIIAPVV